MTVLCRPGTVPGAVELVGQHGVEDVVDQRRLARAADAGDRDEAAEREATRRRSRRLCSRAPDDGELAALGRLRPPDRGRRDLAAAGQVRAGERVGVRRAGRRRCRSATTWPPCSPAPGPMSTTQSAVRMVSSSCSTTISVLPRSRSRVSVSISRRLSRWCRPMLRLVEHVEDADQAGADLGGEPDALRLAAGQRAGRRGRARGSRGRRRAGSRAGRGSP